MTTSRRLLALATSLGLAVLLTAPATPVSARTVGDRCQGSGPVARSAIPTLNAAGCALAGRTVTVGRVSVVVPPAGMGVVGDGVGRHGDVRGFTVTNTGSSVRIVRGSNASAAAVAGDPPACKDKTFHLEGNKWASSLKYHVNVGGLPGRLHAKAVIRAVKAGNQNMRKGHNNCHKPRLKTPASHYLGRTHVKPNIKVHGPSCGKPNTTNVVGFANLPGGLLGWTCYWIYVKSGRIAGADIVMDNGKYLVTKLPKTCRAKWDLEGAVTHEWGHAYGMAHTGSGHGNLTMQHELAPCSTYARTLGLGDWLGMNKMYGHRK
ncbi:MAG: hypothetical protein QM747_02065 [Nocardioides sp.]